MTERDSLADIRAQAARQAALWAPDEPFRWTTERVEALRQLEIADIARQVRGWRRTHVRIGPG